MPAGHCVGPLKCIESGYPTEITNCGTHIKGPVGARALVAAATRDIVSAVAVAVVATAKTGEMKVTTTK